MWSRGHKPRDHGQEHKKIRGQGLFREKVRSFQIIFSGELQKVRSGDLQNFNNSKNNAVFEPRTGQFSRTWTVLEATDVFDDTTSAKTANFQTLLY